MRILVCNDDGYDAPGVHVLGAAAQALSDDVWTIAPERKWTAASHQLSFDADVTLTRRAERSYSCSGAPADCVVAAMTVLFADGPRPDLVLAGINDKRNVGEDVAYSGTMAIAREATFWHVAAIAFSCAADLPGTPASVAALRRLLTALWDTHAEWAVKGHWLNVGLPRALPAPLRAARVGHDKIGMHAKVLAREDDAIVYRLLRGRPGTSTAGDENDALNAGAVAIVRHSWQEHAPLSETLVERWNRAIGDDEAVA
jgi:5'-nucleotidase